MSGLLGTLEKTGSQALSPLLVTGQCWVQEREVICIMVMLHGPHWDAVKCQRSQPIRILAATGNSDFRGFLQKSSLTLGPDFKYLPWMIFKYLCRIHQSSILGFWIVLMDQGHHFTVSLDHVNDVVRVSKQATWGLTAQRWRNEFLPTEGNSFSFAAKMGVPLFLSSLLRYCF